MCWFNTGPKDLFHYPQQVSHHICGRDTKVNLTQGDQVTIFLVACLVIFILPNKVFAWFEYVTSLIKIVIFLIIIVLSLALVLGAGPTGSIHHGDTWTSLPPFLNGFSVRILAAPFDQG